MAKLKVAVHKLTSCDGCQLAFLNLGEELLALAERVDFVHFAEAGPVQPEAQVDCAFVEGSVSTPDEQERIQRIRANARLLVSIGACATAGGLQALRNLSGGEQWLAAIYPSPEHLSAFATSVPISRHVRVDYELWGCPVSSAQVVSVIRDLLFGVRPALRQESVCGECKRAGRVCVMVTGAEPCLGPVTRAGCGSLCPAVGRACYGCFGPVDKPNLPALGQRFAALGLAPEAIARRFLFINCEAPACREAGQAWLAQVPRDPAAPA